MTWQLFFAAVALVFVFEGILPFICPDCWKKMMQQACKQTPHALRLIGFFSMLFGLVLLFIIHHHWL